MTVERITYRDVMRRYADLVESGHADADLSPRERRFCAVFVRTASNDYGASVLYPPTDETRSEIVQRAARALWDGNARALVTAASPSADASYARAMSRAWDIVRGC